LTPAIRAPEDHDGAVHRPLLIVRRTRDSAARTELVKRMSKAAAEHHHKAAEHHEHAARHHREAAKHHESGAHLEAGHHAHMATGHDHHADHHAAEAAKAHIKDHAH